MIYIEIILQITLTTLAHFLLKKGAINTRSIFFNTYVLAGYLLFFSAIGISFDLMKQIDFKYFSAIMSANYLAVMFISWFYLHDALDKNKLLGTTMIALGVLFFI